jgi:hypothetical protein
VMARNLALTTLRSERRPAVRSFDAFSSETTTFPRISSPLRPQTKLPFWTMRRDRRCSTRPATAHRRAGSFCSRYHPYANQSDVEGKPIHGEQTLRLCSAFSATQGPSRAKRWLPHDRIGNAFRDS